MKNFVQPGETITQIAPAAVSSGDGVLVGTIFGVAQYSAASGAEVELARRGVFDLPKKAAEAITAGAKVYWNNTNKEITTTASGAILVGAAVLAAGASDATARVLLDGTVR